LSVSEIFVRFGCLSSAKSIFRAGELKYHLFSVLMIFSCSRSVASVSAVSLVIVTCGLIISGIAVTFSVVGVY